MALEIKISSQQTKTAFFVSDATGDYNAVTNPTGFGAPNPLRSGTTLITFSVTQPDGTVKVLDINTVLVTALTAVDLTTNVNVSGGPIDLMDGVYEIDVTYTVSGVDYTYTLYVLRTYTLDCTLGQLALGDLCKTDFKELKLEYDRMQQVFLCENYVMAEEIYSDINKMLADCNGVSHMGCGCGC